MRSQEAMEDYLRGPGAAELKNAVLKARTSTIAMALFSMLDVPAGILRSGSTSLDDENTRRVFLTGSKDFLINIVEKLFALEKNINKYLRTKGVQTQGAKALRILLESNCLTLIREQPYQIIIGNTPFPDAWEALAHLIARDLYSKWTSGQQPEWLVHNYSLLAGFFLTCRLSEIRLAVIELDNFSKNANSIRGSLLRLAERVDSKGILDILPKISKRTGSLSLQHSNLSPLLTTVECFGNNTQIYKGTFRSQFNNGKPPVVPTNANPVITPNLILAGRVEMLQQYDYTLLGHMTLAAIEQLLRSWAEHTNVQHHINGVPRPLEKWLDLIKCSTPLKTCLNDIIKAKQYNIRNRSNHGGLLEAENMRMQITQQLLKNRAILVSNTWNHYSPENVARLCLECLVLIDREIPTSISSLDLKWIADFGPTIQELKTVAHPNSDLLDPNDGLEWQKNITTYVRATCPAVSIYLQSGYHGWLETDFSTTKNLSKLYALVLVFEAIFRNTLQTMGVNILQVSPQGNGLKINYLMLDETHGLYTGKNIQKLLEALPPEQHEAAKIYLDVAIKIRNALAHGAISLFDEKTNYSMGHCLLKIVQLLMLAGRNHMIRERAYYLWLCKQTNEDRPLADWLDAQKYIDHLFRRFGV